MIKRIDWYILGLVLIIIGGFWLRLYRIDNAIADWHQWRQADTASVARYYYQHGFNLIVPRYGVLDYVTSDRLANPKGYRFVEFPIYPALIYGGYVLFDSLDVRIPRIISVLFSIGSIVWMYLIVKRHYSRLCALLAAGFFSFLPFNIYFSRVVLPEPSLVFFSLGMVYLFDRWISENRIWLGIAASAMTMAAMLTKPTAVFFALPLLYLIWQKDKWRFWQQKRYWLFAIVSITPFLAWRWWMGYFPEGIPSTVILYNFEGIRLKPSWWHWIFEVRLGQQMLTVFGMIILGIGVLVRPVKNNYYFHWWLGAMFVYLVVFASGNVTHDYYQVLLVPVLSVFLARGVEVLVRQQDQLINIWLRRGLVLVLLINMFYFAGVHAKGLFQINNNLIVIAGEAADEILPENAIVVAPFGHDTSFLYHTNRAGYSVVDGIVDLSVEKMIETKQVSHYVSIDMNDKTNFLKKKYRNLSDDSRFVILDLNQKIPGWEKLNLGEEPG